MCDPGPFPAIHHDRTPDAMLQSEPSDFVIVRAQDVIVFVRRGHDAITLARTPEFSHRNLSILTRGLDLAKTEP